MLHVSLLCSSLLIAPPRAAPRRAAAALRARDSVMHASPSRRELLQLTAYRSVVKVPQLGSCASSGRASRLQLGTPRARPAYRARHCRGCSS